MLKDWVCNVHVYGQMSSQTKFQLHIMFYTIDPTTHNIKTTNHKITQPLQRKKFAYSPAVNLKTKNYLIIFFLC